MTVTARSRKTIAAILDAAHEEFAELGPEGARVDRIADRAGANKQRIYAYFGSKDGLFSEVLNRAFAKLIDAIPIPTDLSALRDYAGNIFDYHREDPSLIRLLAWEGLHFRDSPLDASYSRAAYYQNSIANLAREIEVEHDVVARLLFSIVALASLPHVVPQQRRLFTVGSAVETRGDVDALRESVRFAGQAIVDQLADLSPKKKN